MRVRNLDERIQSVKDHLTSGGRVTELTRFEWETMKDYSEYFDDLRFKYVGGKNE